MKLGLEELEPRLGPSVALECAPLPGAAALHFDPRPVPATLLARGVELIDPTPETAVPQAFWDRAISTLGRAPEWAWERLLARGARVYFTDGPPTAAPWLAPLRGLRLAGSPHGPEDRRAYDGLEGLATARGPVCNVRSERSAVLHEFGHLVGLPELPPKTFDFFSEWESTEFARRCAP